MAWDHLYAWPMANLNAQPEWLHIPESVVSTNLAPAVIDACWEMITTGSVRIPDLVETICDVDEYQADDGEHIRDEDMHQIAQYLVGARRQQQALFGDVGPSNLARAFADLESKGVVARQNFSCCGNCGSGEIWDEVSDFGQWRGYVFFHHQDAISLVQTGHTYLSFGIFLPHYLPNDKLKAMSDQERKVFHDTQMMALVNEVIIPTLEAHGLEVSWKGSLDTRILVDNAEFYVPIG